MDKVDWGGLVFGIIILILMSYTMVMHHELLKR